MSKKGKKNQTRYRPGMAKRLPGSYSSQITWQRHRKLVGCQPYAPAAITLRKYSWYSFLLETAVSQWLRCCATNMKFAGSIPNGVMGIFHWYNPSDRTMALGSTQPLTEMSTRSISRGKGGRRVRLTTLPPSCAVVMISGNLHLLEPSGLLQACNGTDLTYFFSRTPKVKVFPLQARCGPEGG